MKVALLLLLFVSTVPTVAFSDDDSYAVVEEMNHEMFLACVSSKKECTQMAHHEGYNVSKVVKDQARCPQRPKKLACIVQH